MEIYQKKTNWRVRGKPFLHKEPEYKVEKLKYKKRGGHATKDPVGE